MDACQADCKIIGGDTNNNLDNYREVFDEINKKDFTILESNEETNVNRFKLYKLRKIDYLFSSISAKFAKNWRTMIVSLFVSRTMIQVGKAEVLKGFDFTMDDNCSDHKPIRTIVQIQQTSKIKQIWNEWCKLFR
jgi:hypothetical protein